MVLSDYNTVVQIDVVTNGVKSVQDLTVNVAKFGKVLSATQSDWVQQNKSGVKFLDWSGKAANSLRMATSGLKGFRMEMLGVMFFGMAIKNFFGQWVQGTTDMLGITDLFKTTMDLFVLEAMTPFVDGIYKLLGYFISLDAPTKAFVGDIILLGYGLGTALQSVGMMALGIGALFSADTLAGIAKAQAALVKLAEFVLGPEVITFISAGISTIMAELTPLGFSVMGSMLLPIGLVVGIDFITGKILGYSDATTGVLMLVTGLATAVASICGMGIMGSTGVGLVLGVTFVLSKMFGEDDWGAAGVALIQGLITGLIVALGGSTMVAIVGGAISIPIVLTLDWAFGDTSTILGQVWNAVKGMFEGIGLGTLIGGVIGGIGGSFLGGVGAVPGATAGAQAGAWIGGLVGGGAAVSYDSSQSSSSNIQTATGGIFNTPQLRLIGEAGPEAVVPLDRMSEFTTNNSSNITVYANVSNDYDVNMLADELSRKMGLNVNRGAYL